MTKEEYAQLGLYDGIQVSLQIRNYRVLSTESSALTPELSLPADQQPTIAEGI
jgi:hypothetical protein